jgi:hypothetical protein
MRAASLKVPDSPWNAAASPTSNARPVPASTSATGTFRLRMVTASSRA